MSFSKNFCATNFLLQGRGCRILPFMTVILRYVGVGHIIFKELLCNKFATPKERVSYPGVSDCNFWMPAWLPLSYSKNICATTLLFLLIVWTFINPVETCLFQISTRYVFRPNFYCQAIIF